MARNMDGRYPQMPGDMIDRNNNGRFDFEDIDIPTHARPGVCGFGRAASSTMFDRNGDNARDSAGDAGGHRADRRLLYSSACGSSSAARVVELVHPGLNHSDDATVMLFPERARAVRDGVSRRRARHRQHPFAAERLRPVRRQPARGMDQVVPHGRGARLRRARGRPRRRLFTKADVTATREYFEELVAAVSAGIAAGKSLEELKESVPLREVSRLGELRAPATRTTSKRPTKT